MYSSCNGEDEDCGDQVEDGKVFAGWLIAQLRDDSSAAEEHCKGTFCQEGNVPGQNLRQFLTMCVIHKKIGTDHHIFIDIQKAVEQNTNFSPAHDSFLRHVTNPPEHQVLSSYLHQQKTHPLLVMMATWSRADTLSTPMKRVTEVT